MISTHCPRSVRLRWRHLRRLPVGFASAPRPFAHLRPQAAHLRRHVDRHDASCSVTLRQHAVGDRRPDVAGFLRERLRRSRLDGRFRHLAAKAHDRAEWRPLQSHSNLAGISTPIIIGYLVQRTRLLSRRIDLRWSLGRTRHCELRCNRRKDPPPGANRLRCSLNRSGSTGVSQMFDVSKAARSM